MKGSVSRRSIRIMTLGVAMLAASVVQPWRLLAQAPSVSKGVKFSQVSEADLREWLTYLSSDELQGRQIYTEGYGVASQYIADKLKSWGVKPAGDNGSVLSDRPAQRLSGQKQFVGDDRDRRRVEDLQARRSRDVRDERRQEADAQLLGRAVSRIGATGGRN
jgi:hypothetical protein